MLIFKKLVFSLPFLAAFGAFTLQLAPFLQNSNFMLSLDPDTLVQTLLLLIFLLFSGLFFVIFSALAQDIRFILPVALIASLIPFFYLTPPLNLLLSGSLFLIFVLSFFILQRKLDNYLTFQAVSLLVPNIRQVITFIIIAASFAFYFSAQQEITANGFKLPSSLLDLTLNQINVGADQQGLDQELNNLSSLTQEITPQQLQLLKENPDVLRKYGIDPKIVDQLANQEPPVLNRSAGVSGNQLLKPMVEQQFQGIIKPYLQFIPAILALLFFFTLQSLASFSSLSLSLMTWLIFLVLEKIGFTKYEIESREVNKLVV